MNMAKLKQEPQHPLILRAHRLIDAFTKSDDERDFYLDRFEGFLVYADLEKPQSDLELLEKELQKNADRYCLIPKLTFYETKKIMEGFVNEKVYDIDTKEKLLDIIQSKEARSNFLEFIHDHLLELEKWQQYYQERSRIRIIEWLRINHFHFVFEEDLELAKGLVEKLKQTLFQTKAGKDILAARKTLIAKAKTYYSNEALNPRPKRGRPPKQAIKQEIEPQITTDLYTTVPQVARPFLFTPDINTASSLTFSSSFETPEQMAARKMQAFSDKDDSIASIQKKLATLRSLSSKWVDEEEDFDDEEDLDDEDEDDDDNSSSSKNKSKKKPTKALKTSSKASATKPANKKSSAPVKKGATIAAANTKQKKPLPEKKRILRPIIKAGNKTALSPNGKRKHKRIIGVQPPVKVKPKPQKKAPIKKAAPTKFIAKKKIPAKKLSIQKKSPIKNKKDAASTKKVHLTKLKPTGKPQSRQRAGK